MMINKKHSVTINYRFEKIPQTAHSPFKHFAETAQHVIQTMPLAIPHLPFGAASRLSAEILTSDMQRLQQTGESSSGNERVRLKAIESSDGILLEHIYDAAGRLLETVYPDGKIVRNRYDDQGRIIRIFSGDTDRLDFAYNSQRRFSSAVYGQKNRFVFSYDRSDSSLANVIRFPDGWLNYKWNDSGLLTSFEDEQSQVLYERADNGYISNIQLRLTEDSWLKFPIASGSYAIEKKEIPEKGLTALLSPLGIHTVEPSGRVHTWLRWDGNRLNFFYNNAGQIRQIWSRNGLTTLDYTHDGLILSLLRWDGKRYFWYGRADNRDSLFLIGPEGVILLPYDKHGRLKSMLNTWGDSASYSYGRYGLLSASSLPRTISSPQWGKLEIGYGKDECLTRISVMGKGYVSLDYDSNDKLNTVTCEGNNPQDLAEVLHLAGWLYCIRSEGKGVYQGSFGWSHLLAR